MATVYDLSLLFLFLSLSLLSSSIGRSGTFCIINIVIERLKVEGMIDIFFTIHALRRKHPGIVANYVSTAIHFTNN